MSEEARSQLPRRLFLPDWKATDSVAKGPGEDPDWCDQASNPSHRYASLISTTAWSFRPGKAQSAPCMGQRAGPWGEMFREFESCFAMKKSEFKSDPSSISNLAATGECFEIDIGVKKGGLT